MREGVDGVCQIDTVSIAAVPRVAPEIVNRERCAQWRLGTDKPLMEALFLCCLVR